MNDERDYMNSENENQNFSDAEEKDSTEEEFEKTEKTQKKKNSEILSNYINEKIDEELKKRKYSKKGSFLKTLVAIVLVALLSSTGTAYGLTKFGRVGTNGKVSNPITISTGENINVEKAVAQKAMPSVVGITTVGVSEDMFLRQTEVSGLGSGVIVSEEGYILTNNHVVDPTKTRETTVLLNDGSKHKAEILWSDKALDLAVVKIDAKGLNLQAAELGDSSTVQIGEKAIAIGSPLGLNLQSTLTSGYISGKDRVISLQDGSQMEGLFQTDAAINPGNSGGALLNENGQLIGINTAKAGNSDGIGFSIPINVAKPILNQIVKTGKFEIVVLGIRGIDVSKYNVLSEKKLPVEDGVYVHEAVVGSPAEQGGIKSGDIITKVGDKKITSNSTLKTALLNYNYGDNAEVEVYRNGETKIIKVNFSKLN